MVNLSNLQINLALKFKNKKGQQVNINTVGFVCTD